MLKAVLIALAALVSFDAAAWQSEMRHALVQQADVAIARLATLDWSWE